VIDVMTKEAVDLRAKVDKYEASMVDREAEFKQVSDSMAHSTDTGNLGMYLVIAKTKEIARLKPAKSNLIKEAKKHAANVRSLKPRSPAWKPTRGLRKRRAASSRV
jgi:hypothetical protein